MPLRELLLFVLLGAIWGSSFLWMRILTPVIGPFWTTTLRVLIAGLGIVAILTALRQHQDWFRKITSLLFIAVINIAIPFFLFAWASQHLSAGYLSILNSTAPLFGAIIGAIWLKEPLTYASLIGIATGIAGVIVMTGIDIDFSNRYLPLGVLACLAATVCYGISANFMKKYPTGLSPLTISGFTQLLAGLLWLPAAVVLPGQLDYSPTIVWSMLALALVCSGVAFVIAFHLVERIGPTRTLSVTLLIPVFGMLWSFLFLGEPVTTGMIGGSLLILTGVTAVLGIGRKAA